MIRVERLTKRFGDFLAVDDVSFEIPEGSLVALLGPSGSGKSTLLRMLAGLEEPEAGRIYLDQRDATTTPASGREVGFVFQHYALFRHLTVAQNVAFGLDVRDVPKAIAARRVAELLSLVGLEGMQARLPAQLSGGQRQRVALARALAPEPRMLLLDEPFGAVDAKVREELRRWLRSLHDATGVTSVFVTHDQDEAFSVSDRVLMIDRGRLEQSGTPTEIIDDPASEFVARFVGDVNLLEAEVHDGHAHAGVLRIPSTEVTGRVHLVVRAHDLQLRCATPGVGTVERVVVLGDRVRVHARIDGHPEAIVAQMPRRSPGLRELVPGCRVEIEVLAARSYPAEVRP